MNKNRSKSLVSEKVKRTTSPAPKSSMAKDKNKKPTAVVKPVRKSLSSKHRSMSAKCSQQRLDSSKSSNTSESDSSESDSSDCDDTDSPCTTCSTDCSCSHCYTSSTDDDSSDYTTSSSYSSDSSSEESSSRNECSSKEKGRVSRKDQYRGVKFSNKSGVMLQKDGTTKRCSIATSGLADLKICNPGTCPDVKKAKVSTHKAPAVTRSASELKSQKNKAKVTTSDGRKGVSCPASTDRKRAKRKPRSCRPKRGSHKRTRSSKDSSRRRTVSACDTGRCTPASNYVRARRNQRKSKCATSRAAPKRMSCSSGPPAPAVPKLLPGINSSSESTTSNEAKKNDRSARSRSITAPGGIQKEDRSSVAIPGLKSGQRLEEKKTLPTAARSSSESKLSLAVQKYVTTTRRFSATPTCASGLKKCGTGQCPDVNKTQRSTPKLPAVINSSSEMKSNVGVKKMGTTTKRWSTATPDKSGVKQGNTSQCLEVRKAKIPTPKLLAANSSSSETKSDSKSSHVDQKAGTTTNRYSFITSNLSTLKNGSSGQRPEIKKMQLPTPKLPNTSSVSNFRFGGQKKCLTTRWPIATSCDTNQSPEVNKAVLPAPKVQSVTNSSTESFKLESKSSSGVQKPCWIPRSRSPSTSGLTALKKCSSDQWRKIRTGTGPITTSSEAKSSSGCRPKEGTITRRYSIATSSLARLKKDSTDQCPEIERGHLAATKVPVIISSLSESKSSAGLPRNGMRRYSIATSNLAGFKKDSTGQCPEVNRGHLAAPKVPAVISSLSEPKSSAGFLRKGSTTTRIATLNLKKPCTDQCPEVTSKSPAIISSLSKTQSSAEVLKIMTSTRRCSISTSGVAGHKEITGQCLDVNRAKLSTSKSPAVIRSTPESKHGLKFNIGVPKRNTSGLTPRKKGITEKLPCV